MSENNKVENPPAFPSHEIDADTISAYSGMSMRDYFASAALTGLLSSYMRTPTEDVKLAYAIADCMIVERSKSNPLTKPTK